MENHLPEEEVIDDGLCINCHVNEPLTNYPNRLCQECREKFINYPIPRWIYLFAGGVLVIMIIGLFRMPTYLKTAIHLSRAEKAMETKKYVTAQNELAQVLTQFPDNIEANAKMAIAASYNWDFKAFFLSAAKLENKTTENEELINDVNRAFSKIETIIPKDTTLSAKMALIKDDPQKLVTYFNAAVSNKQGEVPFQGIVIANYLYDLKDYKTCDQILDKVLDFSPEFYSALLLKSAVKRNTGDFDEALTICNRLLELNHEDVQCISQKSKIELKRNHDEDAAKYAHEALALDGTNISAMEAQALVDFYANRKNASIKMLELIKKQEALNGETSVSTRLAAVINGSESYR